MVITPDSVRVIVSQLVQVDTSSVNEIELRQEGDVQIYSSVAEEDSNRYEVELDAETGGFISIEQTDGAMDTTEFVPPVVDSTTLVSLSAARVVAVGALTGTIESWKLAYSEMDAAWVYTFTMTETSTSLTKHVLVNAESGLLMRIE
jgi:uncharacterized membrane protein YkoI